MIRQLQVFLSYAREDKETVYRLYERLLAESFVDPWLDEERILPGQDWRHEIEQTIKKTDVGLVCLSNRSVTKEGYIQREIRYFLDFAEEKPEGTIFLIPVKLEPCVIPPRLSQWQCVDFFKEAQYGKLLKSLHKRAHELGIEVQPSLTQPHVFKESIFTPLDKTMSNPRYVSDTKCLEKNDYELAAVVNSETVIMVVGCGIAAELCDRPVSEMIRDEIDKRGKENPFRRGIIVTDAEWLGNKTLRRSPAISIGGPRANKLTNQMEDAARDRYRPLSGHTFVPGPPPQVAVWGVAPSDTARSAERFLQDPDGLKEFLRICWQ